MSNQHVQQQVNKTHSDSGQAMIEFALILVVLMGLFLGAFEIMTMYKTRTDVVTAVRLASRQASESFVVESDGSLKTSLQPDIEAYVIREMTRMGYSAADLVTSGDLVVTVQAYEYNSSSLDLIYDGSDVVEICQYGDYIGVEISLVWRPVIMPLDAFFSNGPGTGSIAPITEEHINRCYRG